MDGEGVLLHEDAEVWPASVKNWANEYYVLSVTEGITGAARNISRPSR